MRDRSWPGRRRPNHAAAAEVVIQETLRLDTRCQSETAVERHTLWDFGCRGKKTSVKRTESETGVSKFQIETNESALSLVNMADRQEYVCACESLRELYMI